MLAVLSVDITGNPKAVMHYTNYHKDIVQRYKVKLVGWTHSKFVNPSELSTSLPPLQVLLDAIKSGECKFIKLTADEVRDEDDLYREKIRNGEIILKERATRKDKGKKRKTPSSGNKENEGGDSQDGEGHQPHRKRMRSGSRSSSAGDGDTD